MKNQSAKDGINIGSSTGLEEWLVQKELYYGGLQTNVPRRLVSKYDPRTHEEISIGGMTGGDRMTLHGYASKYAQKLLPYIQKRQSIVLIEAGILKGTGLAIWSDLFPMGRIIGFDIDLSHANEYFYKLKELGAFAHSKPELYEYDQFVDEREKVNSILQGDQIDIYIDDGFHSEESIMQSFASIQPYLSDRFVCFIEDNANVGPIFKKKYRNYSVFSQGELTVVSNSTFAFRLKSFCSQMF